MTQEAITEIEIDVYSRRIKPYFTWLESKIESGWEQSDTVSKDILKETKNLATTMRARFILGLNKEEFAQEVNQALELFELALDAFPGESDEIESKMNHLCKGITGELGTEFLPSQYRVIKSKKQASIRPISAPEVRITIEEVEKEIPQEPVKTEKPKKILKPENKVKKEPKAKKESVKAKRAKKKIAKKAEKKEPEIEKVEKPVKSRKRPVKKNPVKQAPVKREKAESRIKKLFKKFIYG